MPWNTDGRAAVVPPWGRQSAARLLCRRGTACQTASRQSPIWPKLQGLCTKVPAISRLSIFGRSLSPPIIPQEARAFRRAAQKFASRRACSRVKFRSCFLLRFLRSIGAVSGPKRLQNGAKMPPRTLLRNGYPKSLQKTAKLMYLWKVLHAIRTRRRSPNTLFPFGISIT